MYEFAEDDETVPIGRLIKMFGIGILLSIPLMIAAFKLDQYRTRKELEKYDWYSPLILEDGTSV